MILLKNKQKDVVLDIKQYRKKIQILLDAIDYSDFDLAVIFVSEKEMQKINNTFRSQDKPTDVISFPYHQDIKAGEKIIVIQDEDANLGDLILCPAYILENNKQFEGDFNHRMDVMLVHGLCHLLGYDHQTDDEFVAMQKLEKKLLALIE